MYIHTISHDYTEHTQEKKQYALRNENELFSVYEKTFT